MPATPFAPNEIDSILDGALNTHLKTSIDLDTDHPLDTAGYHLTDVADETRAALREEIIEFTSTHIADLRTVLDTREDYTLERIGEDLANTRNHAGTGFWDRGFQAIGLRLTADAAALGSLDLYASADSKVYS